jgi:hypothetical protein
MHGNGLRVDVDTISADRLLSTVHFWRLTGLEGGV